MIGARLHGVPQLHLLQGNGSGRRTGVAWRRDEVGEGGGVGGGGG